MSIPQTILNLIKGNKVPGVKRGDIPKMLVVDIGEGRANVGIIWEHKITATRDVLTVLPGDKKSGTKTVLKVPIRRETSCKIYVLDDKINLENPASVGVVRFFNMANYKPEVARKITLGQAIYYKFDRTDPARKVIWNAYLERPRPITKPTPKVEGAAV